MRDFPSDLKTFLKPLAVALQAIKSFSKLKEKIQERAHLLSKICVKTGGYIWQDLFQPAPYNSLAEIRQDIVDHQRAQAQRTVLVANINALSAQKENIMAQKAVLVANQGVLNTQLQALEVQKTQAMANKGAAEARKQVLVSQQAQAMAKREQATKEFQESQERIKQSDARTAQLQAMMKLLQSVKPVAAPAPAIQPIHRPAPGSPPKA